MNGLSDKLEAIAPAPPESRVALTTAGLSGALNTLSLAMLLAPLVVFPWMFAGIVHNARET